MRSKKLLVALIATLSVAIGGCGVCKSETPQEPQKVVQLNDLRFSVEKTQIVGMRLAYTAYILTEKNNGKKYLYFFPNEATSKANIIEIR